MNLAELRQKLTACIGRLAFGIDKYVSWFALLALVCSFIFGYITLSTLLLCTILSLFLDKIYRKLEVVNLLLRELNDMLTINQRKFAKSIKDHNEHIIAVLSTQKKFFDSIVRPKQDGN